MVLDGVLQVAPVTVGRAGVSGTQAGQTPLDGLIQFHGPIGQVVDHPLRCPAGRGVAVDDRLQARFANVERQRTVGCQRLEASAAAGTGDRGQGLDGSFDDSLVGIKEERTVGIAHAIARDSPVDCDRADRQSAAGSVEIGEGVEEPVGIDRFPRLIRRITVAPSLVDRLPDIAPSPLGQFRQHRGVSVAFQEAMDVDTRIAGTEQ